MVDWRYLLLSIIMIGFSCNRSQPHFKNKTSLIEVTRGPLLGTRFTSYDHLQEQLDVSYNEDSTAVRLAQKTNDTLLYSILTQGVTEKDFEKAWHAGFMAKVKLAISCPYLIIAKDDMIRSYFMSRRRGENFGEGDQSFYDLAEIMMAHMVKRDLDSTYVNDFCDKGFINTFNHVNAQALITSIYSARLADFIADTHERARLPELTNGKYTDEQINDLQNGVVDNLVDMINNEWGQMLGTQLAIKYNINRNTFWTCDLLSRYLNDLQSYYSWVYQVRFKPFKEEDKVVVRFSSKLNKLRGEVDSYKS